MSANHAVGQAAPGRRAIVAFGSRRLRRWSYLVIGLTWAVLLAVMLVRGNAGGVDAMAYWLGTRTWMAGGDPYVGTCPLCYAYAPWAVPLFAPWAVLPWPLAFALWRMVTMAGLAWSTIWAARRRPLLSALTFAALSVPIGINLDTGNLTLPLVLLLWAARPLGAGVLGTAWGLATGLKWVTAPIWFLLSPAARRAGLAALALSALADMVLWTGTLRQVLTVVHMDRPFPIDYLVLAWAAVPWLWTSSSVVSRRGAGSRRLQALIGRGGAQDSRRRSRRAATNLWTRGG